eukprot:188220-Chlamydomonas_euryale.AAC.7
MDCALSTGPDGKPALLQARLWVGDRAMSVWERAMKVWGTGRCRFRGPQGDGVLGFGQMKVSGSSGYGWRPGRYGMGNFPHSEMDDGNIYTYYIYE